MEPAHLVDFAPPLWLRGRHAQTIAGHALRRGGGVRLRRERLETPDGDFVDLDHVDVSPRRGLGPAPDAPVVLVVHGLEGSSRSTYVVEQYRQLLARGLRPVGFNFRSCSGEPNRLPRSYHAGDTADVALVLRHLRAAEPHTPLGVVGFSLGGNVLLKLLGSGDDRATAGEVSAAVAIPAPHDLSLCADWLERADASVYRWYLLRKLRAKVRMKAPRSGAHLHVAAALAAPTIRRYDDLVTAPLHGFAHAAEYYAASSSGQFLTSIRAPTLVLRALDDPFLDPRGAEQHAFEGNPSLRAVLTRGGGHVGFLDGPPWRLGCWAERTAADFLASELGAPLGFSLG